MYTKTLCVIALLALSVTCIAQKRKNPKKPKEPECERVDPLPDNLFNKMILQDITYAIIGEATPTNGLKVDISKPEATISGLFRPKRDKYLSLTSFDFKAGITGQNFSIWKGNNSFGTAFEFRPSFHIIPYCSYGKFGECDVARPAAAIVDVKNKKVIDYRKAFTDSFIAVSAIRSYYFYKLSWPTEDTLIPFNPSLSDSQKNVVIYFIKKITGNDSATVTSADSIKTIFDLLKQPIANEGEIDKSTYLDDVEVTYKKYEKTVKTLKEDTDNKMIANANDIWTQKVYHWFTLTPFGKTEKVNEYFTKYEQIDSSYFKSDYRFYYGITGYYNFYVVNPNLRADLLRVSISLSYGNNLTNLSSFNYEKRSNFFTNGTGEAKKTQTGTAYNHDEIASAFTKQLTVDYYHLPLKSLTPGIYLSSNLNYGSLYKLPTVKGREDDKAQLGAEGGFIFNINSREKDKEKSLFTLLFYTRFEDLTDKRRTSIKTGKEESKDDFMKRNFSIGIKVGIPINLPQRTN